MMSGNRLQIGHDPARSPSYVNHGVKALRDYPREIYRAAQDAQEIGDCALGRARERQAVTPLSRRPFRRRTAVSSIGCSRGPGRGPGAREYDGTIG